MKREEMIEVLTPVVAQRSEAPEHARRRLSRMRSFVLRRELLMHGLVEYDDFAEVPSEQEEEPFIANPRVLLGVVWPQLHGDKE